MYAKYMLSDKEKGKHQTSRDGERKMEKEKSLYAGSNDRP